MNIVLLSYKFLNATIYGGIHLHNMHAFNQTLLTLHYQPNSFNVFIGININFYDSADLINLSNMGLITVSIIVFFSSLYFAG